MKKLLIFLLFPLSSTLVSQEFSTTFVFKDAIGNQDSIVVGYSPLATDSINESLGEKKISETEIDTIFHVYISNVKVKYYGDKNCYYEKARFKTKKKYAKLISTKDISTWNDEYIIKVDVLAKFFPITVFWNKTLFQNDTLLNSFIISSQPGFWFDAVESPTILSINDSILYSPDGSKFLCYYDSIQSVLVPIHKLYICFATKDYAFSIHNDQVSDIKIYPNPCNSFIRVNFQQESDYLLEIITLDGQLVRKEKVHKSSTINLSELPSGVYILRLKNKNSNFYYKLIKALI